MTFYLNANFIDCLNFWDTVYEENASMDSCICVCKMASGFYHMKIYGSERNSCNLIRNNALQNKIPKFLIIVFMFCADTCLYVCYTFYTLPEKHGLRNLQSAHEEM